VAGGCQAATGAAVNGRDRVSAVGRAVAAASGTIEPRKSTSSSGSHSSGPWQCQAA
jgi:hypothetical protein